MSTSKSEDRGGMAARGTSRSRKQSPGAHSKRKRGIYECVDREKVLYFLR